ncbi:hypothetical protein FZ934_21755 (plasmid) [Rhizobium grahamii]|uniref:Uncharacterized protein n=1 Tax=Rhizobium grahamii TaxID=1120045 RepID=A0A5Q0CC17_9HYPH|nr:hypothetical protein FZ934_21755 [Rhizobium grahamii]QRM52282.1 hypothetical protein F3Y33_23900 [Rhizobium sp. BG6]
MSHDYKPSGSSFPGFALLVAIAALVVVLVSVRQPTQAARVWIPGASAGTNSPSQGAIAKCATTCRSIDPA